MCVRVRVCVRSITSFRQSGFSNFPLRFRYVDVDPMSGSTLFSDSLDVDSGHVQAKLYAACALKTIPKIEKDQCACEFGALKACFFKAIAPSRR